VTLVDDGFGNLINPESLKMKTYVVHTQVDGKYAKFEVDAYNLSQAREMVRRECKTRRVFTLVGETNVGN
jgi:hypothetical protein